MKRFLFLVLAVLIWTVPVQAVEFYYSQTETCVDSGDGNAGALTITPAATGEYVVMITLTVNDADGCDITMEETSAITGTVVHILNASAANTATFTDISGVLELINGSPYEIPASNILELHYVGNRWLEVARTPQVESMSAPASPAALGHSGTAYEYIYTDETTIEDFDDAGTRKWRVKSGVYQAADAHLTDFPDQTGNDGKVLSTDGSALSWSVAGAGDVAKVGTPANHQIGVWTGDGTLEGVSVTGSKVMCTDSDGEPTACTNLLDVGYLPLAGGTMTGEILLPDNNGVRFNLSASDAKYSGITITRTVDAGVGSTAFGQAYHVDTDGELIDADADASTTMPCVGLAVEAGTGSKKVLIQGVITETDWNWTIGATIYVSTDPTTTTGLTETAPSGTGDQVQIVGVALSADTIMVLADFTIVEIQ